MLQAAAGRLHTSAAQWRPMGINASGQRDGLPIKAAEALREGPHVGKAAAPAISSAPIPEEVSQTRRSGGRMRTARMDAMLSHGDRIEVAAANLRRASTTTTSGPTEQPAAPPAAGASVDRGIAFAEQVAGADVIEGFDESQLRPAQGVHAKPPGALTNKGGFAGMRREDFLRMAEAAAHEEATGSRATGSEFPTTVSQLHAGAAVTSRRLLMC